jgi:hypothetical protein
MYDRSLSKLGTESSLKPVLLNNGAEQAVVRFEIHIRPINVL